MSKKKKKIGVRQPPEEFSFRFIVEGEERAKLWWDKKKKTFKFEGDVDQAAAVLFETVRKELEEWMLKNS